MYCYTALNREDIVGEQNTPFYFFSFVHMVFLLIYLFCLHNVFNCDKISFYIFKSYIISFQ